MPQRRSKLLHHVSAQVTFTNFAKILGLVRTSVPRKRDALGILRYRLGFTLQASSDLKRPEFG